MTEPKSQNVRSGLVASLLRSIPGVSGLARIVDNRVLLPFALRRAGWHFGPHHDRIGKRKLVGMLNGTFEAETLDIFRRIVPKGAIALDVGANFGFFSRHLSELAGPEGRVFSFEAHPDVYSCLLQNISRCPNVTAYNLAVSDRSGELELLSMSNPLAHSLFATGQTTGNWTVERRIKVPTARIDEKLRDCELADKSLVVKMDIEGAEPVALSGMTGLLQRAPNAAIVVEFAPACLDVAGVAPRAMLDAIWGLGFDIYPIEHPVRELLAPPTPDWHTNLLCVRGDFATTANVAGLQKLHPEDVK